MIVLYTSPGCASCRKAKNYLKEHKLEYIEKNIFKVLLNEDEIKYLIKRTETGTDEIISKRSKIIQENNINLDDMTISELAKFIKNNPSVLKRPIILDEKTMQVGYDSDEIELFIPKELREIVRCDKKCQHYKTCGAFREDA